MVYTAGCFIVALFTRNPLITGVSICYLLFFVVQICSVEFKLTKKNPG